MGRDRQGDLRLYYPRMEYVKGLCGVGLVMILVSQVAFRFAPVNHVSEAVGTMGGMLGGVLVMVGGLIWLASRGQRDAAQAVEAGDYALRWRYDEADWSRFLARQKKPDAWLPIVLAVALGAAAVVPGLEEGHGPTEMAPFVLGFAIGGLLLGLGLRWFNTRSYVIMKSHPGEAVIGPRGAYLTGRFHPWRQANGNARWVEFDPEEPAQLRIDFSAPWSGRKPEPLIVPVPEDRIDDVRQWHATFDLNAVPHTAGGGFALFVGSMAGTLAVFAVIALFWKPLSDYSGRTYRGCVESGRQMQETGKVSEYLSGSDFDCERVLNRGGLNRRQLFEAHRAAARTGPFWNELDHYRRALAIVPDDVPTLREATLVALDDGEYEDVIDFSRRVLAREPEDTPTRLLLVRSLLRTDDVDGALQELNAASEQGDDIAELQLLLGRTLLELGRLDEAAAAYERSATLNPDAYDAQFEYGQLLLRLGRPAEAEPRFAAAATVTDWPRREGFVVEKEARALLGVMVSKCVLGRTEEVHADIAVLETQILDWYWTSSLKVWGYIADSEVGRGEVRASDAILDRARKAWIADGCPGAFDLPGNPRPDAGE